MLNAGKTHDTIRVVDDQIDTPTYTDDLDRLLADVKLRNMDTIMRPIWWGYSKWYEFTKELYR